MAFSLKHTPGTTCLNENEPLSSLVYRTEERDKQLPSSEKHVSAVMLTRHITHTHKVSKAEVIDNIEIYITWPFSPLFRFFFISGLISYKLIFSFN